MDELWDFLNEGKNTTFTKPTFPTRRWGQVYTKETTTDIAVVNKLIIKLKEAGFTVRKRIDNKTNRGTFYRIDIKNHPDKIK